MKVQFGSGYTKLPGFDFNHDIEVNICNPLPYGNDQLDMIVANHVLEHTSSPDALNFLMECHRILKQSGILRISCPVIGQWLNIEHARDLCRGHGHLLVLNEYSMRDMLWMAGFSPHSIIRVDRDERYDTHHNVIGKEKDTLETCRLEATKI